MKFLHQIGSNVFWIHWTRRIGILSGNGKAIQDHIYEGYADGVTFRGTGTTINGELEHVTEIYKHGRKKRT